MNSKAVAASSESPSPELSTRDTHFLRRNFDIHQCRAMWRQQERAEAECNRERRIATWLTERVDGRLMPLWAVGMPGTLDSILAASIGAQS